jgi:hypothetical protein
MTSKILLKLRQNVKDGDYYEAYQMYHSVSQRLVKQKKHAAAVALLLDGVKTMNQFEQYGSSIDLVDRLLDIFDSSGNIAEDCQKQHIVTIFHTFPIANSFCDTFVKNVIHWSIKQKGAFGDVDLHHVFGARYLQG